MASYNKVTLIGNLTRDPEIRYTEGGKPTVCRLSLAMNRSWTNKETGAPSEEVTFVEIVAFGKKGETVAKYMRKGDPLFIDGRLKLEKWETDSGEKRSRLGVILENFQFLGARKEG